MNRWITRGITVASLASAFALVAGGTARADAPPQAQQGEGSHRHHAPSLVRAALALGSLTDAQRGQVTQLEQSRKDARVPVQRADAQLLTQLAQQVEQAAIDRSALQGTLGAEQAAAQAESAEDSRTLIQLHDLLSPGQRGELVDAVERAMPQGVTPPAALETFRGASFDGAALVHPHARGEHVVGMAEAKVPGMSAAERTQLAEHLRRRAARESQG